LALEAARAHGGNGPQDANLRAIESSCLGAGGEFLVGTVDRRVVATGALRHVSEERAAVTRMRVHPAFPRRGFGRCILREPERAAAEFGYSSLVLDITSDRPTTGLSEHPCSLIGRGKRGPHPVSATSQLTFR
jgi:GNAT superfamily N-acetyltransferase